MVSEEIHNQDIFHSYCVMDKHGGSYCRFLSRPILYCLSIILDAGVFSSKLWFQSSLRPKVAGVIVARRGQGEWWERYWFEDLLDFL